MRYALRNKSKITASLGGGYLNQIIKSLDVHFKQNESIVEIVCKQIGVNDLTFIDTKDIERKKTYRFALLGIKYDVYRLAFYKEFDNETNNFRQ